MAWTNERKTILLLTLLAALLMLLGRLLGGRPGAMLFGSLLALAVVATSCWFAERLVLWMSDAREVPEAEHPELYALVRGLAARVSLPRLRVYLVDDPSPNAFAVGRDPRHAAIVLTTGLIDTLDDKEGAAVVAHELAHVANQDTLLGGVLATIVFALTLPLQAVMYIAQWFEEAVRGYGGTRDGEAAGANRRRMMLYLAPLIAPVLKLAIPRRCEFQADSAAAQLSADPLPLASALQKLRDAIPNGPPLDADPAMHHLFIVNPTPDWSLSWLFSTHPPVEARVERLQRLY